MLLCMLLCFRVIMRQVGLLWGGDTRYGYLYMRSPPTLTCSFESMRFKLCCNPAGAPSQTHKLIRVEHNTCWRPSHSTTTPGKGASFHVEFYAKAGVVQQLRERLATRRDEGAAQLPETDEDEADDSEGRADAEDALYYSQGIDHVVAADYV
jgi:hypothetical protein